MSYNIAPWLEIIQLVKSLHPKVTVDIAQYMALEIIPKHVEFLCKKSGERLAEGNPITCRKFAQMKMSDEGCCVGTDVGFGTKLIGKDQIQVFDVKGAANETGPNTKAAVEQQTSFWRRRL